MRGIIALGLLAATASAGVVGPRQEGDQRPWVTVKADGTFETVTPTAPGGSTFTGSVATPTAQPDGSGSFLVCSPQAGENTLRPFCAPVHNTEVEIGKTYFITWDVNYFQQKGGVARLTAEYSNSEGFGGKEAFLTKQIPTNNGFYAWTVNRTELPEVHKTAAVFSFQYEETQKDETVKIIDQDDGPRLWIVRDDIAEKPKSEAGSGGSGGGKKSNKTAVAVGVVVGLVALGFIGFGVWWFGKRKGWFAAAAGYGVRKHFGQRSKSTAANNIKLREGRWSDQGVPTSPSGQNVFREELKRQERER